MIIYTIVYCYGSRERIEDEYGELAGYAQPIPSGNRYVALIPEDKPHWRALAEATLAQYHHSDPLFEIIGRDVDKCDIIFSGLTRL